jgi:hypothetical protein
MHVRTINHDRLVSVATQAAPLPVPDVETLGHRILQPAHSRDQVRFGRFDEQVNSAEGL